VGILGVHAPQQFLDAFSRQSGDQHRCAACASASLCAVGDGFSLFKE